MPGLGGGASAEGKARYRARAKGEGIYGIIRRMKLRVWADVEPDAVHQCDFVFHLTDLRVTQQRTIVAAIIVPIEYMQELTALHLETEHAFGFARAYVVPRKMFMPDDEETDDELDALETPSEADRRYSSGIRIG